MTNDEDDIDGEEYPIYFEGPCTCEHEPDEHGWGGCEQYGCQCEAGWYE